MADPTDPAEHIYATKRAVMRDKRNKRWVFVIDIKMSRADGTCAYAEAVVPCSDYWRSS